MRAALQCQVKMTASSQKGHQGQVIVLHKLARVGNEARAPCIRTFMQHNVGGSGPDGLLPTDVHELPSISDLELKAVTRATARLKVCSSLQADVWQNRLGTHSPLRASTTQTYFQLCKMASMLLKGFISRHWLAFNWHEKTLSQDESCMMGLYLLGEAELLLQEL